MINFKQWSNFFTLSQCEYVQQGSCCDSGTITSLARATLSEFKVVGSLLLIFALVLHVTFFTAFNRPIKPLPLPVH